MQECVSNVFQVTTEIIFDILSHKRLHDYSWRDLYLLEKTVFKVFAHQCRSLIGLHFLSFRCKVCHSSLLPGSYTQGSIAGCLICSHHTTDSSGSTENQPKCKIQASFFSLSGLAITSVPLYTKKTESQDRLVCKSPEAEGKLRGDTDCTVGMSCVVKTPAPLHLPSSGVEDRTVEGAGKAEPATVLTESKIKKEGTQTQQPSELTSPCARHTEGSSRPVPAPRRMSGSSVVPVPAPRTKTQTTNSSPAAGKWPLWFCIVYFFLCTYACWWKEIPETIFVVVCLLCAGNLSNQSKSSPSSPHVWVYRKSQIILF